MRTVRVVAVVLGAALVGGAPAGASMPGMRFWIEYAGNGTVAFACHNVAETLTRDARTADRTTVSCSFNGYPSVPVDDGHDTFHATSAGVADAALGSTVQVCITATAWYFRFHATPYTYYNCADVTVAPAGTLYI